MRTSWLVPRGARFMRLISSWRRGSATTCRRAADSASGACMEIGDRIAHGGEVGAEAGRQELEEASLLVRGKAA